MGWLLDALGLGQRDAEPMVDWCDEHEMEAYLCNDFHEAAEPAESGYAEGHETVEPAEGYAEEEDYGDDSNSDFMPADEAEEGFYDDNYYYDG